ncbi:MAG: flippase [Patescibacteria group bacterium]|nr:flippase [Patescibacteria group bacterium]
MSLARILAWNTGYQFAGKVVSTILGVFVVAIMTRHLGQEGFGMYSTANAFLQFFAILLDFGLNVMVVQMLGERAGDKKYEDRVVSATFTLRTISALVILSIAPIIGLAFPYPPELKIAFFAIWASFFTTALNQIVIGVQQRHLKMHVVAISEVVGRAILLAGVVIASLLGWGLVPIVLIVSVGSTVSFLINFLIARRYAHFAWNVDFEFWKKLLGRSWPIGVAILFNLIYFKADTLVLSFVRPQAEVGIYGAAYRVLEILVTLPFMYAGILLPVIAKSWATGDKQKFSRLLNNSFNVMTLFAAPLVVGTFVLATRGMILVAGSDFAVSGDILRILVVAVAAIFFGTISSYGIVALNAQRKMLPIYIAVAIVTLTGYIIFIPTYGMWAAAWLTVFSEFWIAIGATWMCLHLSKTRWHPKVSFKAILSAVVMGLVIWPLKDLNLAISVVVGIVVYAIMILGTKTISKETIRELISIRRTTPPKLDNPLA